LGKHQSSKMPMQLALNLLMVGATFPRSSLLDSVNFDRAKLQ